VLQERSKISAGLEANMSGRLCVLRHKALRLSRGPARTQRRALARRAILVFVMKRRTLAAIAVLAVVLPAAGAPVAAGRFALVELFTSEGCSSCPPADELLARLSADAARSRSPVATLSFHVTYWDQLGWRDRFSNELFTRRQSAYRRRFALESLYTPQMIVDGQAQFVGSNSSTAERAVHDALARSRTTTLALTTRPERDAVTASCRVTSAPEGSVLWIAWADATAESAPDRGENQGQRLHHVNVVRALEHVPILGGSYGGSVRIPRPAAVPGEVVAWVQQGDVGAVVAGAVAVVGARP
jgi:hypothetical protein